MAPSHHHHQHLHHQGQRPAGVHKHSSQEAKRNAEALFESKTVAEIREIESRTRRDIESKKVQLRNLVGDSYRDLIESADKISSIANNSNSILTNVRGIQDAFTSLAHSFSTSDALLNEKRDSLTKHEELYAVGSRVKYLVDTPELIWGCLDARQHLDAARRYLRAELVHDLLHKSFPQPVLAKFPLLRHHWPTVTKFKTQVVDVVQQHLASERNLNLDMAADLLAALASLQGLDSAALLQALLQARRTWLMQHVALGAAAAAAAAAQQSDDAAVAAVGPAAVAQVLSELAQTVQRTVAQIGELFLSSSKGSDAGCMLQRCVREDDADAGELLFGGRAANAQPTTAQAAPSAQAPELEAWRRSNKLVHDRLAALSSGQVEQACRSWLRDVAEDVGAQCPRLLVGCSSASALMDVELTVRAAVVAWQQDSVGSTAGPAAKRPKSAGPGLPQVPLGVLPPPGYAGAEPMSGTWESVCELVLGRQLNLWGEVFHGPFMARAKQLIDAAFAAVGNAVQAPLEQCLAAAATATPEPAGCIAARTWPMESSDTSSVAGVVGLSPTPSGMLTPSWSASERNLASLAKARSSGSAAPGAAPSGTADNAPGDKLFRRMVHTIQQRFDEQLRGILHATLQLLGASLTASGGAAGSGEPVPRSASESGIPSMSSGGSSLPTAPSAGGAFRTAGSLAAIRREIASSGRAADLEPFVQAKCVELMGALAAMLQARVDSLGQPQDGIAGASAAEQVLVLGRLASALSTDSKSLPVVLGAPDGWRTALAPVAAGGAGARSGGMRGAAGSAAAARAAATNVRLQSVTERLRAAAVTAYRAWARWAAASLASELRAMVLSDDLLTTSSVPLSWQETVIRGEAENALAEPLPDMCFSLPASPSASVLLFLTAACSEVRRIGDHRMAPEALQVFEWELGKAASATFSQVLQPGGFMDTRGLSEKGVLQLLMDVRFVRDVLVGGRPVAARRPGPDAGGAAGGLPAAAALLPGLADDPLTAAALTERKREGAALEALLQERLDPIDWATYETYLWANVARYYQRVAVLLGVLVQLQRAHPEQAAGKAAGGGLGATGAGGLAENNSLNVMPVVPRFHYLPISAPSAPTGRASGSNSRTRLSVSNLRSAAGLASGTELADTYTFADLGGARLGGRQGAGQPAAGAMGDEGSSTGAAGHISNAAAMGASAFSALQARLQGGSLQLGTFGSMLGDKAAEMTAMAQQKFGDIGDFSSALGSAGGLLSSFKNVVKK